MVERPLKEEEPQVEDELVERPMKEEEPQVEGKMVEQPLKEEELQVEDKLVERPLMEEECQVDSVVETVDQWKPSQQPCARECHWLEQQEVCYPLVQEGWS